ncbi:MAG: site-specific tyrosine recombinase/integron integrase [Candidatus Pacearchaeota archaeon]
MNKEDFLKKLEIELKITKNSNYTIRNYLRANSELIDFLEKNPNQINTEDIKFFLAEKYSDKSSSSIILFLAAIRYAYSNLLNQDPTLGVKRPKKNKILPTVLTKDEIKFLINSTNNEKSKLIISLMYACGLRVSELVNLRLDDLDFNERVGRIKQSKGNKDRIFNLPLFLMEDLKEQVEKQKKYNNIYLFSGPKQKLTTRNIQKIVTTAARKANINKRVHCHTLRHSFATHLLENNVDIRKIQELLGHSNLSTTQIYTHISTQELKKIKSPIDSLNL